MAPAIGIGGVFFKARDPLALKRWYIEHLGLPDGEPDHPSVVLPNDSGSYAVWGAFSADTDYFSPSGQPFMVNFRVDDLDALLEKLKAAGVALVGEPISEDYGKFAWIMDPEGTKIELWEPPAAMPGG